MCRRLVGPYLIPCANLKMILIIEKGNSVGPTYVTIIIVSMNANIRRFMCLAFIILVKQEPQMNWSLMQILVQVRR